jgi:2-oxoglutarate dehydrogenase E1 component
VNGDDPEACVRAAQLAYDYRQEFKKDVVIDMVCYRRWGHNEADDPSYTQPVLYRKIKDHPSVAKLYGKRMAEQNVVDAAQIAQMAKSVSAHLNQTYDLAKQSAEKFEFQELSAVDAESFELPTPDTAITAETIQKILIGSTTFPADFHVHPKLRGFLEKRKEILNGAPIDWALGETLAFGSLVLEGTPVRLSGQDSGRGTFSQRHLEFSDAETGRLYIPLRHLSPAQARFDVFDSLLSEYAVMGFEFGYSVADPLTLVLWEAQFGDFANGAQILIDQFIVSAESKWGQPSGLVLLLPHGYEGQGPEHSSARMERFLQLCAENNMQVVNPTTPAQYFHLLRRQMYGGHDRRGVRKPLVVFTPKRMLRHPKAVSAIGDLTADYFREVLPDPAAPEPGRVKRVLICSGQIYYDLAAAREEKKADNITILRLEQIYPFPAAAIAEMLVKYPSSAEIVWVQEEPRNMGAWHFVQDQLRPMAVRYIGRVESASPATGSLKRHQQEQAEIIEAALAPEIRANRRPSRRRK